MKTREQIERKQGEEFTEIMEGNGETIYFLEDHWCYEDQIIVIVG